MFDLLIEMPDLPIEIIDYIFDYILPKNCYLEDSNPNKIKNFALLSKRNYNRFKCKPTFIHIIDGKYLEFCKTHDKVLLENLKRIIKIIKYNEFNDNEYFVKLIINNKEENVALTDFNMEPYVSLMDMNYIYHSIPFPELDTIEITKINKTMKQIFDYLSLKFNTSSYGVNSCLLHSKFNYLNNLINYRYDVYD